MVNVDALSRPPVGNDAKFDREEQEAPMDLELFAKESSKGPWQSFLQ